MQALSSYMYLKHVMYGCTMYVCLFYVGNTFYVHQKSLFKCTDDLFVFLIFFLSPGLHAQYTWAKLEEKGKFPFSAHFTVEEFITTANTINCLFNVRPTGTVPSMNCVHPWSSRSGMHMHRAQNVMCRVHT